MSNEKCLCRHCTSGQNVCWKNFRISSDTIQWVTTGFGGDMWDEVPPRATHPWRHLACHALTPPMAGLTIDAQVRRAVSELLCSPAVSTVMHAACSSASTVADVLRSQMCSTTEPIWIALSQNSRRDRDVSVLTGLFGACRRAMPEQRRMCWIGGRPGKRCPTSTTLCGMASQRPPASEGACHHGKLPHQGTGQSQSGQSQSAESGRKGGRKGGRKYHSRGQNRCLWVRGRTCRAAWLQTYTQQTKKLCLVLIMLHHDCGHIECMVAGQSTVVRTQLLKLFLNC